MKGCFMDKQTKQVVQSLLEHLITYSPELRERKDLWEIYHQSDGKPSKKDKDPQPTNQWEKWGMLFMVLTGLSVIASLLSHLPT